MTALVCFCNSVQEDRIIEAIRNGCQTVDSLGTATLAGTGCNSCHPDLEYLIRKYTPSSKNSRPDNQLSFGF